MSVRTMRAKTLMFGEAIARSSPEPGVSSASAAGGGKSSGEAGPGPKRAKSTSRRATKNFSAFPNRAKGGIPNSDWEFIMPANSELFGSVALELAANGVVGASLASGEPGRLSIPSCVRRAPSESRCTERCRAAATRTAVKAGTSSRGKGARGPCRRWCSALSGKSRMSTCWHAKRTSPPCWPQAPPSASQSLPSAPSRRSSSSAWPRADPTAAASSDSASFEGPTPSSGAPAPHGSGGGGGGSGGGSPKRKASTRKAATGDAESKWTTNCVLREGNAEGLLPLGTGCSSTRVTCMTSKYHKGASQTDVFGSGDAWPEA
mmetsp:Transcript_12761/g.41272  ORF Transcript_12761/g.41272 Transcript_12761/m.41272 type:complete len:319 (+) Transcript_12761:983-1939(+)